MTICVLVIEQNPLTREALLCMLDWMKHAAVPVKGLDQALRLLEAVKIDVAIISLNSDDPDGVILAELIKASQRGIKLIAVSDVDAPEELGPSIDAFVQKPFSLQEIDQAIRQATGTLGDIKAE